MRVPTRRTGLTAGSQSALSYTYDNASRLTQIAQGSATVSFSYDNASRRATLTRPNGVEMTYGYDNGSRLTGTTDTLSTSMPGNLRRAQLRLSVIIIAK